MIRLRRKRGNRITGNKRLSKTKKKFVYISFSKNTAIYVIVYPFDHIYHPVTARLGTAHSRSISMTAHSQRHPSGGARFIFARYPFEFVV